MLVWGGTFGGAITVLLLAAMAAAFRRDPAEGLRPNTHRAELLQQVMADRYTAFAILALVLTLHGDLGVLAAFFAVCAFMGFADGRDLCPRGPSARESYAVGCAVGLRTWRYPRRHGGGRNGMIRALAALVCIAALPAAAQDTPFHQLIEESIGYANIGPGLLLVEDDVSSHVCRVYVSDVFFFGYAEADQNAMDADPPQIVCVPTPQVAADALPLARGAVTPFDQLVDESIGYANISPGILLIEDDMSSHVCRVQIDELYFIAFASGNAERMRQLAPTIVCVPSTDLTR